MVCQFEFSQVSILLSSLTILPAAHAILALLLLAVWQHEDQVLGRADVPARAIMGGSWSSTLHRRQQSLIDEDKGSQVSRMYKTHLRRR
eukprot:544154-Hanusia_phi.AAC.2